MVTRQEVLERAGPSDLQRYFDVVNVPVEYIGDVPDWYSFQTYFVGSELGEIHVEISDSSRWMDWEWFYPLGTVREARNLGLLRKGLGTLAHVESLRLLVSMLDCDGSWLVLNSCTLPKRTEQLAKMGFKYEERVRLGEYVVKSVAYARKIGFDVADIL